MLPHKHTKEGVLNEKLALKKLVTTLAQGNPRVLWEMMNRRWDIEENRFHQLKTYYHAKHCYCHAAKEKISV